MQHFFSFTWAMRVKKTLMQLNKLTLAISRELLSSLIWPGIKLVLGKHDFFLMYVRYVRYMGLAKVCQLKLNTVVSRILFRVQGKRKWEYFSSLVLEKNSVEVLHVHDFTLFKYWIKNCLGEDFGVLLFLILTHSFFYVATCSTQ
jgi:hypothetical protein